MKLCIVTVIKDEQEYLEDWIKFNLEIGIDKIFIVEDIGSKSHKSIINKYKDWIELLTFDLEDIDSLDGIHKSRQKQYQIELLRYVKKLEIYDWCFIIDSDEYITITEKNITLKNLMSNYTNYLEVILYWKNFGANGYIKKPDYSKVSSYRDYYTKECGFSGKDMNFHIITKKAVNLQIIPEDYELYQHFPSTNNYIIPSFQKRYSEPCYDVIYLSHYITKSWEEYVWKLNTRGMCWKNHRKLDDFFEMNPDMLPLKEELLKEL